MDESSVKVSPTKAVKKAKGTHVLSDLDLKSVSSIEQSYREIFGAYASLPASSVDQLNDILLRFTVDPVKDWATSATGQAWPKLRKKEAYYHVAKEVVKILDPGVVSTAKPNKSVTSAPTKPILIDLTGADNAPADATADMSGSTFSPHACLDTDRLKDIG